MVITADERRSVLGLFNVSEAARELDVPVRKMHWDITAGHLRSTHRHRQQTAWCLIRLKLVQVAQDWYRQIDFACDTCVSRRRWWCQVEAEDGSAIR